MLDFLNCQNGDENEIRHAVGMKMFVGWIKERKEHKQVFENSSIMRMGQSYLRGKWNAVRKIRVVRLIRKVIEEGIIVRGVMEIYEEACKILSAKESEKEREGGGGEEDRYMYELYLLKVRGIQKKLKDDEVSVLRREVEQEKRRREEVEKARVALQKSGEAEKKKSEERVLELQRQLDQLKVEERKQSLARQEEEKKVLAAEQRIKTLQRLVDQMKTHLITSLDGVSLTFPQSDGIKREGNIIIHHGSISFRNCFIAGVMTSV